MSEPAIPSFRTVPRTGVIYVMSEAALAGYSPNDSRWSNLGQGMPETGPLDGGPPRAKAVAIDPNDLEYAPIPGIWELREAVAGLYNARYRRGRASRYSAENVAIAGGGRAALTRVAAALGHVNLGHFLPDYTAYEELLDIFRSFASIPILREPERGYAFSAADLKREIMGRGLGAVLASDPSNPTGKVVAGEELEAWVAIGRELDCTLILDEFYSHYVWQGGPMVSAAQYIEDVDKDPIVILDGLTKNWRYPGWRISWTLAPKPVIQALSSAGSFLDGGGSRPLQRAAIKLVEIERSELEAKAIQTAFTRKRDLMLGRLEQMGVRFDAPPVGTFYCWGSVENLPKPFNTGMGFFRKGLEAKVITVPGEFFDVNPGKRRMGRGSRFKSYVRFSFGPAESSVKLGLDRLAALLAKA